MVPFAWMVNAGPPTIAGTLTTGVPVVASGLGNTTDTALAVPPSMSKTCVPPVTLVRLTWLTPAGQAAAGSTRISDTDKNPVKVSDPAAAAATATARESAIGGNPESDSDQPHSRTDDPMIVCVTPAASTGTVTA